MSKTNQNVIPSAKSILITAVLSTILFFLFHFVSAIILRSLQQFEKYYLIFSIVSSLLVSFVVALISTTAKSGSLLYCFSSISITTLLLLSFSLICVEYQSSFLSGLTRAAFFLLSSFIFRLLILLFRTKRSPRPIKFKPVYKR